jgi:hypothetical protein
MGTVIDPLPVAGLVPNFSPMPWIAPPPLGSEIVGAEIRRPLSESALFSLFAGVSILVSVRYLCSIRRETYPLEAIRHQLPAVSRVRIQP